MVGKNLDKICTYINHGSHRLTAAMVPQSLCQGIQQSSNLLCNKSTLLKLEYLIIITTNHLFSAWCIILHCTDFHHPCRRHKGLVQYGACPPVPHLPQCKIKTVHSDDVLLLRRRQKVLGGVKNSHLMQPLLHWQNPCWTWCYVIRTEHHQPTPPGTETIWIES